MVKSIIRRIIVGTGIALALMFIKGNLLMSVSAMTIQNATPTSMYMVDTNGTMTDMGMQTFSQNGLNTTLYGRSFSGNNQRFYFLWNFDSNWDLDLDKPVDIHFLLYSTFSVNQQQPYRVFIVDHNHNAYSCHVESGAVTITNSTTQYLPAGAFSTVSCSNIGLSAKTLKVYVGDTFYTASGFMGISKLSIYPHENGNQEVVNAIDDNTQATQDVNDTLNDDTIDDQNAEQTIEDLDTMISSNSNVSDLITMPITMLQQLVNSLGQNSCGSQVLGTLYGHQLSLPCIKPQNYLGGTIWGSIDIILCGLFALTIRKKVVDIFNNITSLKDRGNEFE